MRNKLREVTRWEDKLDILQQCTVLHLGLQDEDGVFIVPVSFGFEERDGQLTLYLHSDRQGRKAAALIKGGQVALELDCGDEIIPHSQPCRFSVRYRSLMGAGIVRSVEDPAEKEHALQALMAHYTDQTWQFPPAMVSAVAVFAIQVTRLDGKQHL